MHANFGNAGRDVARRIREPIDSARFSPNSVLELRKEASSSNRLWSSDRVRSGKLSLRRSLGRHLPSKPEQVMATKSAPIRLEQPVECLLDGVPYAYGPKLDRFAVCTAPREQPHKGADHDPARTFTGAEHGSWEPVLLKVRLRLDSRTALNCSGLPTPVKKNSGAFSMFVILPIHEAIR